MRTGRSPLAASLIVLAAAGCGNGGRPLATRGPITVLSGYALPVIGGGQSAFVSIRNDGGAADTVIRFVSPLADAVTLHQTLVRNGTARMTEAERLVLEPGRTAVMASGGLHLMLRGVAPALAPGDSLPLELILALAGRVVVSVPVVAFADAP